jgi:hypothetical protein
MIYILELDFLYFTNIIFYMLELPELEVLKEQLLSQIKGKIVQKLKVLKACVLKDYFTEDLFD